MYLISIYMNIAQLGCDGVIRTALMRVKAASEFSRSRRGGGGSRELGWGQIALSLFPDVSTQRLPANKIEVLIKGSKQLAHFH